MILTAYGVLHGALEHQISIPVRSISPHINRIADTHYLHVVSKLRSYDFFVLRLYDIGLLRFSAIRHLCFLMFVAYSSLLHRMADTIDVSAFMLMAWSCMVGRNYGMKESSSLHPRSHRSLASTTHH
jgi:hypothetical protein